MHFGCIQSSPPNVFKSSKSEPRHLHRLVKIGNNAWLHSSFWCWCWQVSSAGGFKPVSGAFQFLVLVERQRARVQWLLADKLLWVKTIGRTGLDDCRLNTLLLPPAVAEWKHCSAKLWPNFESSYRWGISHCRLMIDGLPVGGKYKRSFQACKYPRLSAFRFSLIAKDWKWSNTLSDKMHLYNHTLPWQYTRYTEVKH